MTVRVSIDVRTGQLRRLGGGFARAANVLTRGARANSILLGAAQILVGEVRESILRTLRGGRNTVRTGALGRSYREYVRTRPKVQIAAESDLIYARIQDQGGVIRPRIMKRLAIPLIRLPVGKWPRHWPRGALFRRGNALSRMRGGEPQNVYALARSVRLQPKGYLDRAARVAQPRIGRYLVQRIREGLPRG